MALGFVPNQPVIVCPSANGYWIIPIPGPLAIPAGSVQRWDKQSMFAFLDNQFPDKVYVTTRFDGDTGGHA